VIKLNAEVLAKGNLENIRDQADFYSFKKIQPSVNDLHKIYAITEDKKGLIWVGTNSGLFRISPATKLIEAFKNSQQEKTSLSSDDVRSIIASYDSQIWVGTSNGGLNKFVEETNSFERYSINDGLPDNTIYSIAEDREQKLWLGTNKGLCWFDPITLQSQLYSPEDGVQSYEFNTNSVCKTSDDWLLFGGINGFNMFSPAKISSSASSKNLVFTSIKVNNQEYPITDDQLSLSHNENFISFEFNLLDFYKNDKIQYAYKLDGLEKDWNYLRSAQKASYPGLNPGNYTFMVKAASHNGLWSDEVTLLHLYIAQPWWKSLWFIILSGSLFAAIIYTFYKNRQIQREKIIELRHRISQDLHDEIGSTLSSISLFGTVAHKLAGSNPVGTQDMLTKINESTTQVMESMNDIVWAINSDNDKVGNLQKRMRAFISELDDASDVNISLQVDENLKDTFINMVQRRNVYLIFKEATNNAFKYANASQINITLSQSNNLYKLLIQDNGIGFDLNELASKTSLGGNGLKNMKQRAGELNGTLEIISSKNQGSEISFSWNPKSNPALSHNK
jgi:two-component sensor histidine kinase